MGKAFLSTIPKAFRSHKGDESDDYIKIKTKIKRKKYLCVQKKIQKFKGQLTDKLGQSSVNKITPKENGNIHKKIHKGEKNTQKIYNLPNNQRNTTN